MENNYHEGEQLKKMSEPANKKSSTVDELIYHINNALDVQRNIRVNLYESASRITSFDDEDCKSGCLREEPQNIVGRLSDILGIIQHENNELGKIANHLKDHV